MPTDHTRNTANGNELRAIANTTGYLLTGRTTNLPIYDVRLADLIGALGGPNLTTVVKSIVKNDNQDAQKGFRQPTNHQDLLGNLPVAPGNGVEFREYYLAANGFTKAAYIRLIADIKNKRMFITPTHYDVWLINPVNAAAANTANKIAPAAVGAQNPFFLLSGAGAWNALFW
jgi:hypothetical protein